MDGQGNTGNGHLVAQWKMEKGHLHGQGKSGNGHLVAQWKMEKGHLDGRCKTGNGHSVAPWKIEKGYLHRQDKSGNGHLVAQCKMEKGHLDGLEIPSMEMRLAKNCGFNLGTEQTVGWVFQKSPSSNDIDFTKTLAQAHARFAKGKSSGFQMQKLQQENP